MKIPCLPLLFIFFLGGGKCRYIGSGMRGNHMSLELFLGGCISMCSGMEAHHSSRGNVGNKSTIGNLVVGKMFLQQLNCFNCHVKLTEEIQLGEAIYLNIGLEKDISLVLLLLNIVTFISQMEQERQGLIYTYIVVVVYHQWIIQSKL